MNWVIYTVHYAAVFRSNTLVWFIF